jgi:DNA (cytosine-5)-methyltransferase 1
LSSCIVHYSALLSPLSGIYSTPSMSETSKKLKYIDLFAGCGGLSLGLHNAGWKGLFAIEKSPDAFMTLEHNLIKKRNHFEWPDWLEQKSHEIDAVVATHKKELRGLRGKVDLVAGGPPCQGFSMAGRRNEGDSRNNLINSYIQFVKLVKPKLLFFENVKGFTLEFKKNREKGKDYAAFVAEELNKAGYWVHGQLVNFGEYGVPQKRVRFILVGISKEVRGSSKVMAESFFSELKSKCISFLDAKDLHAGTTLEEAISDLLRSGGEIQSVEMTRFQEGCYSSVTGPYQQLMRKEGRPRPDSHRFARHSQIIEDRFASILRRCIRKNTDIPLELRQEFNIKKHTIIPLEGSSKTPTITTLPDDYVHYCEPRILTVREYARIQSFPDWYEFKGKYTTGGKRRTQEVPRYSQIGNAIPPLFGEHAGNILNELIGQ